VDHRYSWSTVGIFSPLWAVCVGNVACVMVILEEKCLSPDNCASESDSVSVL
jgi:hypothetical protein